MSETLTKQKLVKALMNIQLQHKVYAKAKCTSMESARSYFNDALHDALDNLDFDEAQESFVLVVNAITAHVVEMLLEELR